jgi:predicted nucleic acid-binding protein
MVVRFADTSVLLYAISRHPAEQDKAKRANDLLGERDLALSVQVLHEFYVRATRVSRRTPLATSRQFHRFVPVFCCPGSRKQGQIADRPPGGAQSNQ